MQHCFYQSQSNQLHASLTRNTESAVPGMQFVSSSLSGRTGWPTGMYVVAVLPRNAFTVSGWPRIFRRNAVRHLESMFNLMRCQSRSVMPNRWTRWPTPLHFYIVISMQWSSISLKVRTIKVYGSSLKKHMNVLFCGFSVWSHAAVDQLSAFENTIHFSHCMPALPHSLKTSLETRDFCNSTKISNANYINAVTNSVLRTCINP